MVVGAAECELVDDGAESLVGAGLEVLDGLAGGVGLLVVVLGFVPATGEDGGPDQGPVAV